MENNKNQQKSSNTTNTLKPINMKNSIKSTVLKMKEKQNLFFLLGILIILLTFVFFTYTFDEMNKNKNKEFKKTLMNKNIERKYERMPLCSQIIDSRENYRLNDYFINSSFNSALIGNQINDYVSLDFLMSVINAGARYIELQINGSNNKEFPEPVIGSGNIMGRWSDSLNTIDLSSALKKIRQYAFSNNKNYPLIIYLEFNNESNYLLKRTGELLNSYLDNYILENRKYKSIPITLEKMCNLEKKIVILSSISSDLLVKTPLESIIIPPMGYIRRIYYKDANNLMNLSGDIEKTLSIKQQEQDEEIFNENFPSIQEMISNPKYNNGDDFMNKLISLGINNPLFFFNKIGMTIVIPHLKEDKFTLNFEPELYWNNGCQFVAMNFQESTDQSIFNKVNKYTTSDKDEITEETLIMVRYLAKFKNKGIVLRDDDYRFIERDGIPQNVIFVDKDEREKTILNLYPDFNRNFFSVFAIQSFTYSNKYLDTNMGLVRFSTNYEPENNNLFMFYPALNPDYLIKEGITITSARGLIPINPRKRHFLTQKGSDFIFSKVLNTRKKNVKPSTFYAVMPSCQEQSLDEKIQVISFRNSDEYDPSYLGYNQNLLATYQENTSEKMKMNSCFNVLKQEVKTYIYIKYKKDNRFLFCSDTGKCSFRGNKPNRYHRFEMVELDNQSMEFKLKGKNNRYLTFDDKCKTLNANIKKITTSNESQIAYMKINIFDRYETLTLYNNINKQFDTILTSKNNKPQFVDKRKPSKEEKVLGCRLIREAKYHKDNRLLKSEVELECFLEFEVVS